MLLVMTSFACKNIYTNIISCSSYLLGIFRLCFSNDRKHVIMFPANWCIFVSTANNLLSTVGCNPDCENGRLWGSASLAVAAVSLQLSDYISMGYEIYDLQE